MVDDDVTAHMPGGALHIRVDAEGRLWLRGPVEEIAQIMGKSAGAVKLLLHRAVERLRRELPPELEVGLT